MSKRTTIRAKAAQSGLTAAGLRFVAIVGGVTKVLRVYEEEPGVYGLYNLTAGFVKVPASEAKAYRFVTVRYADSAATNLGYLRYQNMLAASFIPEGRTETLAEMLGDSRWSGVRGMDAVQASLLAQ